MTYRHLTQSSSTQAALAPPMEFSKRKGARHPSLVPAEVHTCLIAGAETVNFMEQISLDQVALLAVQFPELLHQAQQVYDERLMTRMKNAARILLSYYGSDWIETAADHSSDTVRGWASLAVGLIEDLSLGERLDRIYRFAEDSHFGVREWAWLSLRPHIVQDPLSALHLLAEWTLDVSPRVRRFASEATRPIGVWSAHIPQLKRDPRPGKPLLNALRLDSSRYVQDSVANWLNDAAKTNPTWVRDTCESWASATPSTGDRILRRAQRSIV